MILGHAKDFQPSHDTGHIHARQDGDFNTRRFSQPDADAVEDMEPLHDQPVGVIIEAAVRHDAVHIQDEKPDVLGEAFNRFAPGSGRVAGYPGPIGVESITSHKECSIWLKVASKAPEAWLRASCWGRRTGPCRDPGGIP